MNADAGAALSKADRTRSAIVDAALALFTEQGFDATTMRAIAQRAEVSVGNAYYYFESKEQLVLAIYERFSTTTTAPILAAIAGHDLLADRIERATLAWLRVMRPYRSFANVMFRNVVDPASAMSPLGPGSASMREESYELWRAVLDGATDVSVDVVLADGLVRVFWGYTMAMVVAWTQDPTADARRVKRLVRRSAPLLARLVGLSAMPVFASFADELQGLLADVIALRD
jgi:AcrR family transcriptional regulator